MRKGRSDAREYITRRENESHTDMKLSILTGTNFEEFDLSFTASVSRKNDLIEIQLDYLLMPYAVGYYNVAWNS